MTEEIIYTWRQLNDILRRMKREEDVLALYERAKRLASPRWRQRIWHRYCKLRNNRERRAVRAGRSLNNSPRRQAEEVA